MDVCSSMGPERVLPNSEDELGGEERPADGGMLPVWSGGEEEEEEEEEDSGGYYYQPLNQEPDGPAPSEQLQQVQHRIQVMGLHLPEAPPTDSDDEDPEGAAAVRSHASIPMDADHVELVKRTMAAVALPSLGVPPWASELSDAQWKDLVQNTLESRQSAPCLPRRNNVTGP